MEEKEISKLNKNEKLNIDEVLEREGLYVGPTVGISMLPMLKTGRDTIVVLPKKERLKPLDVALYHRGKDYVLHRVLALENGGYTIRGDNCYSDEHIAENDVIGVLSEFFRKGKHYYCTDEKYLRYAKKRVKNYRIRSFSHRVKSGVRRCGGKVLRKLGIKK